ncbi:MAG: OmpA family protein [Pseudomonadota bacterium]
MQSRLKSLALVAASAALVGCGASPAEPKAASGVECVDIPNGQYFQVVEGRLVSTSLLEINGQERPYETAFRIANTLSRMGYPWVRLEWDGQTAILSGLALDENTRTDAFLAAKSLLETDMVAGRQLAAVINEIEVRDPVSATAVRLSEELADDGYPWLNVVMAGKVATLTGAAPSVSAKTDGYLVGRSTVESDLDAGERVNIVVDALRLNNGGPGIGAPLLNLTEGASAGECQDAFYAMMTDRNIQFEPNESVVLDGSSRLLDAATGIALLCESHTIEIESHIAGLGDDAFNLDLSQRRASAVRDYLMAYGVAPDALVARGYGASRPLVAEEASNADQLNVRTVFVVRPRSN